MVVLKVTSHLANNPIDKPKVSVWKDFFFFSNKGCIDGVGKKDQ